MRRNRSSRNAREVSPCLSSQASRPSKDRSITPRENFAAPRNVHGVTGASRSSRLRALRMFLRVLAFTVCWNAAKSLHSRRLARRARHPLRRTAAPFRAMARWRLPPLRTWPRCRQSARDARISGSIAANAALASHCGSASMSVYCWNGSDKPGQHLQAVQVLQRQRQDRDGLAALPRHGEEHVAAAFARGVVKEVAAPVEGLEEHRAFAALFQRPPFRLQCIEGLAAADKLDGRGHPGGLRRLPRAMRARRRWLAVPRSFAQHVGRDVAISARARRIDREIDRVGLGRLAAHAGKLDRARQAPAWRPSRSRILAVAASSSPPFAATRWRSSRHRRCGWRACSARS